MADSRRRLYEELVVLLYGIRAELRKVNDLT